MGFSHQGARRSRRWRGLYCGGLALVGAVLAIGGHHADALGGGGDESSFEGATEADAAALGAARMNPGLGSRSEGMTTIDALERFPPTHAGRGRGGGGGCGGHKGRGDRRRRPGTRSKALFPLRGRACRIRQGGYLGPGATVKTAGSSKSAPGRGNAPMGS
jgi:hypothetical protein